MRLLLPRVPGPIGAERHNHHLADDVLAAATAASARPRQQRVLDHRHHAVGAGRDEARLDWIEQVLVDLHPIEGRLVQRCRHVAGGVVLEAQIGTHSEQENVAQDRAVGVVADDLGDLGDLAPAVWHAGLVHDEVHRGCDLRANSFKRDVDGRHHHHRLQAGKSIPGGVRVDGRHASVVPSVHRLQHVERFGASHLSDEDAVGAHPEAVAQQLANGQLALAFDVGGAVFEGDDVRVVDLQLGGVLDRDHTLVVRDEPRDDVQGRRLAGAGPA